MCVNDVMNPAIASHQAYYTVVKKPNPYYIFK